MLDLTKIGNRITVKRKEFGFTQNSLAETLYVTHQAVSKWENGKSIPSIEIMYELTKLFHISIDYLLDNTDIDEDNYEQLFKNYPRDIVLNNFIASHNWEEHIVSIFYLLNNKERMKLITILISKNHCPTIQVIWPYLNKGERLYLLGNIVSNKCDFDINLIRNQLTSEETIIVQRKHSNGTYPYKLHYHR